MGRRTIEEQHRYQYLWNHLLTVSVTSLPSISLGRNSDCPRWQPQCDPMIGLWLDLLGLNLRHGQESSPCLSGTNASLYTSDGFSVHTKAKHGNAKCRGKSVYVPARRRRDRPANFTILGDGGVPMPEPELTSDYTPVTGSGRDARRAVLPLVLFAVVVRPRALALLVPC